VASTEQEDSEQAEGRKGRHWVYIKVLVVIILRSLAIPRSGSEEYLYGAYPPKPGET
jgi:hypothetical protein